MNNVRIHNIRFWLTFLIVVGLLGGCGPQPVQEGATPEEGATPIETTEGGTDAEPTDVPSGRATECVTRITENCTANFTKVNDISMYYEIHGLGEPLIMLHGAADSIESMRYAIIALSENYRVIAVDTRGHGRSTDSDQPFSYDLFAKDILELMDLLEIDKAHIVGLSDGGITGLTIAITYPDRINKLVTVGANFSPEGLTDLVIERMSSGEFFDNSPSYTYERFAPDPSKWPDLIEKLRQMILSEPNYTQDDLGKIRTPVLVMLGEGDKFIRIDHTEELHRMIEDSTLFIVSKAEHNVFDGYSGNPDAANEAILEFLVAE